MNIYVPVEGYQGMPLKQILKTIPSWKPKKIIYKKKVYYCAETIHKWNLWIV